ncbi:hypothetical protein MJO28_009079 [Puccinia striiformis f. sp. tritici]|uniref:Uncharacterized protein n=1 Tax=Puccinia striiformis f. sp. tritici TaxID=168172 RepID=A0ACC0E887_9BASI|nr:hypothetical protein MJO28_009079 [Puccinia striiformis f. sp. tritici]
MLLHPGALLTLSILVSQLPAGSSGRSLWKRIVINDVEVVPSSPSADLIEGSHINAIKENPSIEPADRKEMLILPHSPSTEFKEELHTNSNKEKPSDEPEGHKDLSMIESKINGEKEKPLSEQEGYKDSLVLLPYPSIGFKIKEKEVGKEKPSKDLKGPKDLETNTAEDAEPRKGLTPLAEEPEETISLERFRIMAPRVTGIDPAEINDITRHFKVKYAGDRDVVPRRELIDLVYRWMTEWYKEVPTSPSADLKEGSHINAIKENPSIEPADRKEMLILPHSPSTESKQEPHINLNKEKPSNEPEGHKDLSMIVLPSHSTESKQESKINGDKDKPLSQQEGHKDSLVTACLSDLPFAPPAYCPILPLKPRIFSTCDLYLTTFLLNLNLNREKKVGKEKPSKDPKGPKDLLTCVELVLNFAHPSYTQSNSAPNTYHHQHRQTGEDAKPRKGLTPLPLEPEKTLSLEHFRIMAPRVTGIDPAEINDITRHFKVKYAGDRDVVPRRELIDLVYRWMTGLYKESVAIDGSSPLTQFLIFACTTLA